MATTGVYFPKQVGIHEDIVNADTVVKRKQDCNKFRISTKCPDNKQICKLVWFQEFLNHAVAEINKICVLKSSSMSKTLTCAP